MGHRSCLYSLGMPIYGGGTDQYGDQSDMMGYSYDHNKRPLMCFNAAKRWYLNWYSIRYAYINTLNTNGNVELHLIGINDFLTIRFN